MNRHFFPPKFRRADPTITMICEISLNLRYATHTSTTFHPYLNIATWCIDHHEYAFITSDIATVIVSAIIVLIIISVAILVQTDLRSV